MKSHFIARGWVATWLMLGGTAFPGSLSAAEPAASPADRAWANLRQAAELPAIPAAWREERPSLQEFDQFRQRSLDQALTTANAAREFIRTYPAKPRSSEARQLEHQMLLAARRYGERNADERLAKLEKTLLSDPALDVDAKAIIRYQQIQREATAKRSESMEAYLKALEAGARAMLQEFPGNATPYQILISLADRQPGAPAHRAFQEIADDTRAPDDMREQARGLLRKLDALGKPLELRFTAVDGREVDLQKLRGKVVLVDFWATWCGPCVAELPHVKAAYEKLHPRGFEIVGISFDTDQSALEKFVKKHGLAWPQYFDGKGWKNALGRRFGINSIPAMWLVDPRGILRDQNARANLEAKVEKLLAGKVEEAQ